MAVIRTFNNINFSIPQAGEVGWASLTNFLVELADLCQVVTFQKGAIRTATSTPQVINAGQDYAVMMNVASASQITLPVGVLGQRFLIHDASGAAETNNITVLPQAGQTIEGDSSYIMATSGESAEFMFAGSNTWRKVFTSVTTELNPTFDTITITSLTANRAVVSNGSKQLISSAATATEVGYLSGVTSPIQTQLDGKLSKTLADGKIFIGNSSNIATAQTMSGDITISNTGVASIGTGKVTSSMILDGTIVNADINASAGITYGKLNLTGGIVNADISISAAIDAAKIANGSVSDTEFQYLDGVTSPIQTQLDGKANRALSNLASVAINTALLPATDNSISLGSDSKEFDILWAYSILHNSAGTPNLDIQVQGNNGSVNLQAHGTGRVIAESLLETNSSIRPDDNGNQSVGTDILEYGTVWTHTLSHSDISNPNLNIEVVGNSGILNLQADGYILTGPEVVTVSGIRPNVDINQSIGTDDFEYNVLWARSLQHNDIEDPDLSIRTLDNSGNIFVQADGYIEVSSTVQPQADGSQSLGTDSREFGTLWIASILHNSDGYNGPTLEIQTQGTADGYINLQANGDGYITTFSELVTVSGIRPNININQSVGSDANEYNVLWARSLQHGDPSEPDLRIATVSDSGNIILEPDGYIRVDSGVQPDENGTLSLGTDAFEFQTVWSRQLHHDDVTNPDLDIRVFGNNGNIILEADGYVKSLATDLYISGNADLHIEGGDIIMEDPGVGTNKLTIQAANPMTTDWTFSFPPDPGSDGYVLTTNGAGQTTWELGGSGSFALTDLSNLDTTTAINSGLIPNTTNAYPLGTSGLFWSGLFATTIRVGSPSHWVSQTVSGSATSYSIQWPDTLPGTGTRLLKTNSSGTLTWSLLTDAEISATAAIDATKIADGSVTSTEFQYINSLTSNAQTQIDGKASTALSNLASVAINTSLISDTNLTDDLGTDAIEWKRLYVSSIYHDDSTTKDLSIRVASTGGNMLLQSDGYISTNANIQPTANNSKNLGTDTFEFGTLWTRVVSHNDVSNPNLIIQTTGNNGDVRISANGSGVVSSFQSAFHVTGNNDLVIEGGDFKMNGDSSGTLTQQVPATITSYSIIWPSAQSSGTKFLQNDGSGNLSWSAATGFATTALDNLASVAINTTLVSDTNNTDDLGTDSIEWKDIWAYSLKHNDASTPTLTITTTGNNGDINLIPHGTGAVLITDGNLHIASGTAANELRFYEPSGSGTNYTAFKAQAQAGDVTYILPAAAATVDGYVLSSTTGGSLSWIAQTGGGSVGPGTTNTISKFTSSTTIGDSQITDDGSVISVVASLQTNIATADQTGDTGPVDIYTGNSTSGHSGPVQISTGETTAAGDHSGTILLETGRSINTGGYTNDINLVTGDSDVGSGWVTLETGYTNTSETGSISLTTGQADNAASAATSGDIIFLTGNADSDSGSITLTTGATTSGTRGSVTFDASNVNIANLTASRVVQTDASKNLQSSSVTTTELGYVSGVTSGIQTQFSGKANTTLNNLASVAINTTLVSDTDDTDNLGSAAIAWSSTFSKNLIIGKGDASGATTGGTIRGPARTGADAAGVNTTFDAGNGTGTGGSGDIIFRTAPVAASSSSANTLATVLTLGKTAITAALPLSVTDATDSTSSSTGALKVTGGILSSKKLRVEDTTEATSSAGSIITQGGILATKAIFTNSTTDTSSTSTGSIVTTGGVGMAKALWVGTTATVASTTESTSSTTGALQSKGGIAAIKNIVAGGQIGSESVSIGSVGGGTTAIDFNSGNVQYLTLTGSQTLTFSNPIDGVSYLLQITQGGSGSYTITWPSMTWKGGAAPTLSTTVGAVDIISIIYIGGVYRGSAGLAFS